RHQGTAAGVQQGPSSRDYQGNLGNRGWRSGDRWLTNYCIKEITMSNGNIVQCIGPVVDIKFPREAMPKVYDALLLDDANMGTAEAGLTFEVQQQLGDGVVRTIALGSSDGLRRGMNVK